MAKFGKTRLVLNHRGIREFLRGPVVADDLLDRAERVQAAARAAAPVGADPKDSGQRYRDNLDVELIEGDSRTVARVYANVPYALKVEAEHGTLARALRQSK